jgi:hypothetical protein
MKILILILACKSPIYLRLESVIDNTWNSIYHQHIETYYYYGNSNIEYHDNRNIYIQSGESLAYATHRTIRCFDYCLNNFDFDYILRTNCSSYINKNLLYDLVQTLPETVYAGVVGVHNNMKFASGAGMLISRNNIEYLVDYKNHINMNLIDDVAIAECLNKKNTILPLDRYDFNCSLDLPNEEILKRTYHFRCKCENNRTYDEVAMHKIHKHITQK